MHARHDRQRGISLVEAMVALAVMAFGTLAVLGVQTTLRVNGDLAKQRNEAVRIAQEAMEQARAIFVLADYQALLDGTTTDAVAGYAASNTTYQITRTIKDTDAEAPALPARRKTVVVEVTWLDRADAQQSVLLTSVVQGAEPALAGSLAVPADMAVVRNPGGRNPVIPQGAVNQGDGTSRYNPPGGGGIGWVFNNQSGLITKRCTDITAESCVDFSARLLSGYVRFATFTAGGGAPAGIDSESPLGLWEPVAVEVEQTLPAAQAGTVACFGEMLLSTAAEVYYCAVPVGVESAWSGQARLVLPDAQAFDAEDAVSPDRRRVCRYTPVRDCQPAVGSIVWGAPGSTLSCSGASPTPSRLMLNADHPIDYVGAKASLTNQNFLVIRAGDGTNAYECPPDGPSAYQNSNTWKHQPSS